MIWLFGLMFMILLVLLKVLQQQKQLIDKETFNMTVAQIKAQLAQNRLDLQATVQQETVELSALIGQGGGAGGATAAQLDEIGQGIADNQAAAIGLVQAMSDNVAAAPNPNPNPQP